MIVMRSVLALQEQNNLRAMVCSSVSCSLCDVLVLTLDQGTEARYKYAIESFLSVRTLQPLGHHRVLMEVLTFPFYLSSLLLIALRSNHSCSAKRTLAALRSGPRERPADVQGALRAGSGGQGDGWPAAGGPPADHAGPAGRACRGAPRAARRGAQGRAAHRVPRPAAGGPRCWLGARAAAPGSLAAPRQGHAACETTALRPLLSPAAPLQALTGLPRGAAGKRELHRAFAYLAGEGLPLGYISTRALSTALARAL